MVSRWDIMEIAPAWVVGARRGGVGASSEIYLMGSSSGVVGSVDPGGLVLC